MACCRTCSLVSGVSRGSGVRHHGAIWSSSWSYIVVSMELPGRQHGATWSSAWSYLVVSMELPGRHHGATWSSAWSYLVVSIIGISALKLQCVVDPTCPVATAPSARPSSLETQVSRTTDLKARCGPGRFTSWL